MVGSCIWLSCVMCWICICYSGRKVVGRQVFVRNNVSASCKDSLISFEVGLNSYLNSCGDRL